MTTWKVFVYNSNHRVDSRVILRLHTFFKDSYQDGSAKWGHQSCCLSWAWALVTKAKQRHAKTIARTRHGPTSQTQLLSHHRVINVPAAAMPTWFVDHRARFTRFKWSCNSAISPGFPGRMGAKGLIKNLWVKNSHLRTLYPLSSVWGLLPCKYGQEYHDLCFMGNF